MKTSSRSSWARALLGAAVAFAALGLFTTPADAQRRERSGQEVVDAVCAACHVPGKDKAPKIGDAKAWSARASQGLNALTDHAIKGIRNMPAHGGNTGVSDIEIERAVIYMVNRSGGNWIEPVGGATPAVMRTSEAIVSNQCAKCHQEGLNGAPKIGDRPAWIPRLKNGLDKLVASAIHGHGGMPARGGLPDLSDQEIRGAIVYMFNYGVPEVPPSPPAPPLQPNHKVIAGTDIYLGMISAESLRAAQAAEQGRGAGRDSQRQRLLPHQHLAGGQQVAGADHQRHGQAEGLRRHAQRHQDARAGGGEQCGELWQLLPALLRQLIQHHRRNPAPRSGERDRGQVRIQGAVASAMERTATRRDEGGVRWRAS